MPGTNSVPVKRVVTTMFAASQTMMVLPKPIVRSVSAPGSTESCPRRAIIPSSTLQSPPSLFPLKIIQREIEMIPGLNYYTLNTSIGGYSPHLFSQPMVSVQAPQPAESYEAHSEFIDNPLVSVLGTLAVRTHAFTSFCSYTLTLLEGDRPTWSVVGSRAGLITVESQGRP